jgi:Flp pilus assembly protein TadG
MRHERAQASAEFALVAPDLFLVVFAIIQMGYTFGKQLELTSATADGARRAAVSINNPDPRSVATMTVRQQLTLTKSTDATVAITPMPPWEHGQTITVTTSVPHAYHVLGVSKWAGTLRATSEIRVE